MIQIPNLNLNQYVDIIKNGDIDINYKLYDDIIFCSKVYSGLNEILSNSQYNEQIIKAIFPNGLGRSKKEFFVSNEEHQAKANSQYISPVEFISGDDIDAQGYSLYDFLRIKRGNEPFIFGDGKQMTIEQVFGCGAHNGHCGVTACFVASNFLRDEPGVRIVIGKNEAFNGTFDKQRDGEHVWIETSDFLIDTTLMLIFPIEKKKELGYVSHERKDVIDSVRDSKSVFHSFFEKYGQYSIDDEFFHDIVIQDGQSEYFAKSMYVTYQSKIKPIGL